MVSIKHRIEKLENAIKIQSNKYVITRVIVDPDGTILGTIRRVTSGEYVSVLEEESLEIGIIN